MPSALVESFIGGSYTPRSTNIADDATVNLFVETSRIAGSAKTRALIGTPGLLKNATLSVAGAATGCGGIFVLPQTGNVNGIVLAAIDGSLYKDGAIVGAIGGTPGNPFVTFASNGAVGNQVAICSDGELFIYTISTGALSAAIVLPLANAPVMVGFIDGYFLLLEARTGTVWYSALYNGNTWDALDFFRRSHTSDLVLGFVVVDSRIWTFGASTIELFYDSGDADNPFAPYPGSVLPYGTLSASVLAVSGNTIVWIATRANGALCVMAARLGAEPQVISTPAIDRVLAEAALSQVTANPDMIAYRAEGHSFVCFTLPAGDTWCVDMEEPGHPWHQRASTASLTRWRARGCAFVDSIATVAKNFLVVGDYQNGNVYQLDLSTYTDNLTAITRLRRAPYLSAENQWLFIDAIELGLESGVGNSASTDPQVTLRLSRDSGNTYGTALSVSMGAAAAYNARAKWNRLGRARADRLVIEVSTVEPVKVCWTPGLWLRAAAGTGEL